MAATFIQVNKNSDFSRPMIRALQLLREGFQVLEGYRAQAIQARDGDGSDASHYDQNATLGGYVAGDYASADAAAKASFDEIDSLYALLNEAAINQACAKHGIV